MTLRMIEAIVPQPRIDAAREAIAEVTIIGAWHHALDGDQAMLRILARSEKTESIIEALEQRFFGDDALRIVIIDVEATLPRVEDEPVPEGASAADKPDPQRVAVAELVETLSGGTRISRTPSYAITVLPPYSGSISADPST